MGRPPSRPGRFGAVGLRAFGLAVFLADALRAGVAPLRAGACRAAAPEARRRAFGLTVVLDEAFRAGRDVRRRPPDFFERWRDFACLAVLSADARRAEAEAPVARGRVLRPAFRVRAIALRFAITRVLSAAPAFSKEGPGHP